MSSNQHAITADPRTMGHCAHCGCDLKQKDGEYVCSLQQCLDPLGLNLDVVERARAEADVRWALRVAAVACGGVGHLTEDVRLIAALLIQRLPPPVRHGRKGGE